MTSTIHLRASRHLLRFFRLTAPWKTIRSETATTVLRLFSTSRFSMTMQFNAICALPGPYGSCETKRPSHHLTGQDQPVYGNEQQNQEVDLMGPLRNWIVAFCLLFVFVPRNVAQNNWIGTWTASPQSAPRGQVGTFHNQTVRLIVHTSAGGKTVRIKISNTFGDQPLVIGAARIARRASEGGDRSCLRSRCEISWRRVHYNWSPFHGGERFGQPRSTCSLGFGH